MMQNVTQVKSTKIPKIVPVKKYAKGNGFQALGVQYVSKYNTILKNSFSII